MFYPVNPAEVSLQAYALTMTGEPKLDVAAGTVRVYHIDTGVEVEDLAAQALVNDHDNLWRYVWSPLALPSGMYTAEFYMIDSGGLETLFSEDLVVQPEVDLSTVPNLVWDEPLTGASHNVPTSAGRRLRQLASQVVWDGFAAGPGINGNQIELDGTASALDGAYDPALLAIVGGTGAGQCRGIFQYDGATKIATVDRDWKENPDITSEIIIYAWPGREHVNEGLARAGGVNTIKLNANASAFDGEYVGQLIFLRSGTGQDQVRMVIAYDGTTKVATVSEDWHVVPDTTTCYAMLPAHAHEPGETADAVWDEARAGHVSAGSFGAVSEYTGVPPTPPTPETVADAVWDEARAGHVAPGSFGAVDEWTGVPPVPPVPPTPSAIADAVWDENAAGHVTPGTFGSSIESVKTEVVNIAGAIASIATDLAVVKKVETGRWKIENNQMVFYDDDGVTPLLTFDLKDAAGDPSSTSVFERVRV